MGLDSLKEIVKRIQRSLRNEPTPRKQLSMHRLISPDEDPATALAEGYEYTPYEVSIEKRWVSLINVSGDFQALGIWTKDTLHTTVIQSLAPGGAVLVTQAQQLVAAASLCYSDESQSIGTLMYLLVHHDHRRRGLGQTMLQRIIQLCQNNGMKELRLLTDAFRLEAIKLYLRVGFAVDFASIEEFEMQKKALLQKLHSHKNSCHGCWWIPS